jgi:hypothetical protein
MDSTHGHSSDVAFTASVKAVQTRKGSRRAYERMEQRGSWSTRVTPDLARFIQAQTSVAQRRRVKIWGTARIVEGDVQLVTKLMPKRYQARAEQAIVFTVSAWDANCPQHIPRRFEEAEVRSLLAQRDQRIEALEAELRLRPQAP